MKNWEDYIRETNFTKNNRFTKEGAVSSKDINELLDETNENQFGKSDVYYKLKHYEDLEQKGLLLELPCHINDTVYRYSMKQHKVIPFEVTKMYFDYNSDKKLELFIEGESIINNTYQDGFKLSLSDFNEQIFLTEEESKVIACNSSSKPITSIPFTKKYPTYTITYEPQSDMFLITNERCFYYEYNKEFQDKKEAFNYFKNNYLEFIKIRNVSQQIAGQPISSKITIALNNYEYVSYYCSDKELKKMIPDIKKEVEEIKKQNNKNKPDFCEDDFDMVF
jgi:hypothetical protein